MKYYTHIDSDKYSFQVWIFSARGVSGVQRTVL